MKDPGPASAGNPVVVVLLAQLGLGIATATIFWGVNGIVSGYSALLGGLICVIPNAFLALRLAVSGQKAGAESLVRAAYIGELGKLALTVVMFIVAFTLVRPLAAGSLFAGFIAAHLATFAGFLVRDNSQVEVKSTNNGE